MDSCVLPSDVMMEILTRTSSQALGSIRETCRELNDMTYESWFVKLHQQRTKAILGYFTESRKKNKITSNFISINESDAKLSLDFLPHRVMIEACTKQGILCCRSQEFEHNLIPQCYVCKPTTKQWEVLPNPKTRYFTEAVAMMALSTKPLHYKIVRLSRHRKLPQSKKGPSLQYFHCEVFDSKVGRWKKLENLEMPFCEMFVREPAVAAGGMAHWLTTESSVVAFDFNSETFRKTRPPHRLFKDEDYRHQKLVEYKGKLGLMCMYGSQWLELWIIKCQRIEKCWRKWRWNMEDLRRIENYPSPAACYDGEVIVMKGYDSLIFYNPDKDAGSSITRQMNGINAAYVYPFYSDFELLEFPTNTHKFVFREIKDVCEEDSEGG